MFLRAGADAQPKMRRVLDLFLTSFAMVNSQGDVPRSLPKQGLMTEPTEAKRESKQKEEIGTPEMKYRIESSKCISVDNRRKSVVGRGEGGKKS